MEKVSGEIFRNNLEFRNWVRLSVQAGHDEFLYSLTLTAGLGVTGFYAICGVVGQKEDMAPL